MDVEDIHEDAYLEAGTLGMSVTGNHLDSDHLPIGWGTLPFHEILGHFRPRPHTIMIIEQKFRFDAELETSVKKVQGFMATMNHQVEA